MFFQRPPPREFFIGFAVLCLIACGMLFYGSIFAWAGQVTGVVVENFRPPRYPGYYPTRPDAAEIEKVIQIIKSGNLPPLAEDAYTDSEELKFLDMHLPVLHGDTTRYLERIIRRLVSGEDTPSRRPYNFRITIYDDRFVGWSRRELAISLSDGKLFMGVWILLNADNEAEVAGWLAHEMAHTLLRHVARGRLHDQNIARLEREYGRQDPSGNLFLSYAPIVTLWQMRFAREEQTEADGYGQKLLRNSGYDDRVFLQTLKNISPGDVATILYSERIARGEKNSQLNFAQGQHRKRFIIGAATEFRAMQAALKTHLEQLP